MSPIKTAVTACEIYDQALKYARDDRVPPGTPQPGYTSQWLDENVATLERFREWLSGGGISQLVIRTYHIPMAGHILGMNHKPSAQLDLEHDLQKAMDYVLAKGLGASWTHLCQLSLLKFRLFLLQERGQSLSKITPYDPAPHTDGLPGWLVNELQRYQRLRQGNWRDARLEQAIRRFWSGHLRVWRFLVEQRGVQELDDLKRQMVYDYADLRLKEGHAVRSVNGDLRSLHGFLGYLQDQGYTLPHALLRLPCLKEPDTLPKALSDEQVKQLRDDFEQRVLQANGSKERRDALLDRAAFYLMWQGGLRRGEVEELRQEDLNLNENRLTVRRGKGMSDRTVYLTDAGVNALKAYLAVRGMGPTDHVFLYRNLPLSKDLLHGRIKAAGARAGVSVYCHRLRHTCATQLLNAGCRITSIQKFLGHKRLNSTLTYARVHDQTVADDYFSAMSRVEQRLELISEPEKALPPIQETERERLTSVVNRLAEPELPTPERLELVGFMQALLNGEKVAVDRELVPSPPAFRGVLSEI